MPEIIILPHEEICPEGAVIKAEPGISLCDAMLTNNIEIEHACEKSCACTTAWGLDMDSRLSCQAIVGEEPLVIEIPKYTINMVSETH